MKKLILSLTLLISANAFTQTAINNEVFHVGKQIKLNRLNKLKYSAIKIVNNDFNSNAKVTNETLIITNAQINEFDELIIIASGDYNTYEIAIDRAIIEREIHADIDEKTILAFYQKYGKLNQSYGKF